MFSHFFDYKKENRPFNEFNSLRVLLPTFKPVLKNNLICCKTGLMWVVKRATSLFTSFCSNYVAKQVARCLLPVLLYLKIKAIFSLMFTFLIQIL